MDSGLRIRVAFTDESVDEVKSALQESGAEELKEVAQRGFTGLEFVIFGLIVSQGLTALVMKLTQLWKCGVVVDARGATVVTQRNCDLPRGSVLIISADGTQTKLEKPSEVDIATLIKSLLPSKG